MYRLTIFVFALIFGIYTALPTLLNSETGKKINLGLDLQGGLYLTLEVNDEISIQKRKENLLISINNFVSKEKIIKKDIRINKEKNILIELSKKSELDKIINFLKELQFIDSELIINENNILIVYSEDRKEKIKKESVEIVLTKIRDRLNIFGLSEPSITKYGTNRIIVEVPGVKTIEEQKQIEEFLLKKADLSLMIVEDRTYDNIEMEVLNKVKLPLKDSDIEVTLDGIPLINGDMIINSQVGFDLNQNNVINFELNNEGAQIFADWTSKNIGKRMAIVLNNIVQSAPMIQSRIGGGHVQITGKFDMKEANELSMVLRSGAFPTEVKILEKRSIGPSLGAESVKTSLYALVGAFIIVLLFMIIYYKKLGIISNIALITNILLIVGIMSLFQATLTLPGMAGIVLTIGMAIDANIIINERIKELIEDGKSQLKIIEEGYSNALSSILDANITTLLVTLFLYVYGTGPVKGFAVTMAIGIIVSMITSIIGTHGINKLISEKTNIKLI